MSVAVKNMMKRYPRTCAPGDTLAHAVARMKEFNCGILPVVEEDGRIAGVLTDRDVCLALGPRALPASEIRIEEVMSENVLSCRPDDAVSRALRTMASGHVHRLPVLEDDGALCGILSLTDVLQSPDVVLRPLWPELLDTFRAVGEPSWEWEGPMPVSRRSSVEPKQPTRGKPPFPDRLDVARRLAERLAAYKGASPLLLAIPRGGLPIARTLADTLGGDVDVALTRKLTVPDAPGRAIGTVSESGHVYLTAAARTLGIDVSVIRDQIEHSVAELGRWRNWYSPGRGPAEMSGRVVIVVDDGILTGSTMNSVLRAVRAGGPSRVVAALGVAPAEAVDRVKNLADEVVVLATPEKMESVDECYDKFPEIPDSDAIALLRPEVAQEASR